MGADLSSVPLDRPLRFLAELDDVEHESFKSQRTAASWKEGIQRGIKMRADLGPVRLFFSRLFGHTVNVEVGNKTYAFGRNSLEHFLRRHAEEAGLVEQIKRGNLNYNDLAKGLRTLLDNKDVLREMGDTMRELEKHPQQNQHPLQIYKDLAGPSAKDEKEKRIEVLGSYGSDFTLTPNKVRTLMSDVIQEGISLSLDILAPTEARVPRSVKRVPPAVERLERIPSILFAQAVANTPIEPSRDPTAARNAQQIHDLASGDPAAVRAAAAEVDDKPIPGVTSVVVPSAQAILQGQERPAPTIQGLSPVMPSSDDVERLLQIVKDSTISLLVRLQPALQAEGDKNSLYEDIQLLVSDLGVSFDDYVNATPEQLDELVEKMLKQAESMISNHSGEASELPLIRYSLLLKRSEDFIVRESTHLEGIQEMIDGLQSAEEWDKDLVTTISAEIEKVRQAFKKTKPNQMHKEEFRTIELQLVKLYKNLGQVIADHENRLGERVLGLQTAIQSKDFAYQSENFIAYERAHFDYIQEMIAQLQLERGHNKELAQRISKAIQKFSSALNNDKLQIHEEYQEAFQTLLSKADELTRNELMDIRLPPSVIEKVRMEQSARRSPQYTPKSIHQAAWYEQGEREKLMLALLDGKVGGRFAAYTDALRECAKLPIDELITLYTAAPLDHEKSADFRQFVAHQLTQQKDYSILDRYEQTEALTRLRTILTPIEKETMADLEQFSRLYSAASAVPPVAESRPPAVAAEPQSSANAQLPEFLSDVHTRLFSEHNVSPVVTDVERQAQIANKLKAAGAQFAKNTQIDTAIAEGQRQTALIRKWQSFVSPAEQQKLETLIQEYQVAENALRDGDYATTNALQTAIRALSLMYTDTLNELRDSSRDYLWQATRPEASVEAVAFAKTVLHVYASADSVERAFEALQSSEDRDAFDSRIEDIDEEGLKIADLPNDILQEIIQKTKINAAPAVPETPQDLELQGAPQAPDAPDVPEEESALLVAPGALQASRRRPPKLTLDGYIRDLQVEMENYGRSIGGSSPRSKKPYKVSQDDLEAYFSKLAQANKEQDFEVLKTMQKQFIKNLIAYQNKLEKEESLLQRKDIEGVAKFTALTKSGASGLRSQVEEDEEEPSLQRQPRQPTVEARQGQLTILKGFEMLSETERGKAFELLRLPLPENLVEAAGADLLEKAKVIVAAEIAKKTVPQLATASEIAPATQAQNQAYSKEEVQEVIEAGLSKAERRLNTFRSEKTRQLYLNEEEYVLVVKYLERDLKTIRNKINNECTQFPMHSFELNLLKESIQTEVEHFNNLCGSFSKENSKTRREFIEIAKSAMAPQEEWDTDE